MSTAGVPSGEGREVVTLKVSKDADGMTGHEVAFLMDTGAECNLLPLDVYKGVTGDLDLNSLDTRVKSVLILANGYVIAKVDQPTDWVSSMLVVSKPPSEASGETKIRICLDPRDLNVAIKREHFPMPTIQEIATRLNGAKLFSVFDASNGFW